MADTKPYYFPALAGVILSTIREPILNHHIPALAGFLLLISNYLSRCSYDGIFLIVLKRGDLMSVAGLIEILQKYDDKLEVRVLYQDSGGVYSGSAELVDVWEENGSVLLA
jgi:hypothetical protein